MEQKNLDINDAMLRGAVGRAPTLSHESHGETFYLFPLVVARLSGTEDTVNVLTSGNLLAGCALAPGAQVEVRGEVRTFNNRGGTGNRLVITLYARSISSTTEEPANELKLCGTLCRTPVVRRTPLGREICDLMLAVNRRYGRSDYLPCIAWGSVAQACGQMAVGARLTLSGRLQSRTYIKETDEGSQERVAYEVSVMGVEP